ncbi:MAG: hypothetical protein M1591_01485 [Deltaproteobacteria bacterium]|nr:hypothetical protein [Deltaproteobacteria bacterium]MCL5277366.1 hypothetical protein [Deltaproteobacteria bacterium]
MINRSLLSIAENELQIAALVVMAFIYTMRLRWMFKKNLIKERTPARGDPQRGARASLLSIAMPWTMESMIKHPLRYIEFVIFHLGVAAAITASFIIPYASSFFRIMYVMYAFQGIIGLAVLAGIIRLIKRLTMQDLKLISSMDDYFSLILLDVWMFTAFFSIPNNNHTALTAFFILTAFFLIYVPFSKISHYLYYPFARTYFGRHFGRRGVYPKVSAKNMEVSK